jgi:hypothetical protein
MPRFQRSNRYFTIPGATRPEEQALCPRLLYAALSALRMVELPQSTPNLFRLRHQLVVNFFTVLFNPAFLPLDSIESTV